MFDVSKKSVTISSFVFGHCIILSPFVNLLSVVLCL